MIFYNKNYKKEYSLLLLSIFSVQWIIGSMEHNQIAVFEQASDSDSSFGDDSTMPISQSDQVIPEKGLSDSAKFSDRIFCKGIRYSARGGGSTAEGSQYGEPATSLPQTSQ